MEFTRSINNAQELSRFLEKGHIELMSPAKSDYYNSPAGDSNIGKAPLMLTEVDNMLSFTFIAKVKPEFISIFDAGALFIYADEDHWLKLAFEMDEEMNTRIVSVRTKGKSDDSNHSIIIREDVYLKISSDTHQIGLYYSNDKEIWSLARLFENDFPQRLFVGLSSQSPTGEGNHTLFKDISLSDKPVKNFRMGV